MPSFAIHGTSSNERTGRSVGLFFGVKELNNKNCHHVTVVFCWVGDYVEFKFMLHTETCRLFVRVSKQWTPKVSAEDAYFSLTVFFSFGLFCVPVYFVVFSTSLCFLLFFFFVSVWMFLVSFFCLNYLEDVLHEFLFSSIDLFRSSIDVVQTINLQLKKA